MQAAVLQKVHELTFEERPRPVPAADEVLAKIKAVGICGSDLHFYHEGRIGDKLVERPFVLGHEASAEVVEVGANVTNFKPGDRVCLEPGIPCRVCAYCKRGEYHLCPNGVYQSGPHTDGFFQEYTAIPADYVYHLPANVDYIAGAAIEPFVVGLHAAWRAPIEPGQSVLVLGAGPIGLMSLQAAAAHGATNIMIVDVIEKRLNVARELGATHVLNGREVQLVEEVQRLTGGLGADVVLETAGAIPTIQQSVWAARRGGTVVLVGMASQSVLPFDTMRVTRAELNVKGSFRYVNQFPKAIALAAAGKVNLGAIITHTFPLERIQEAFEFSLTRKDEAIKVVITI
ncbi:MAG: NAD(P)-dependent alcohol dehydrogenase [Chloroflexota bacterium]